ncbi:MAG: hypothetical protein ACR2NN_22820 [Bryobacteraceae bacterium]
MQVEFDRHVAEDVLEKYAMGKIAEDQIPPLEEHLLVCSDCQVRLAGIDDYVLAAKGAAAELENKKATRKPPLLELLSGRFWHIPAPLWAAGLAAAMAITIVPFTHRNVPETEVYLSTLRGSDTGTSASGKVLLNIDTSTLATSPAYQLQLVSSSGSEVWKSRVIPQNGRIIAAVPRKLGAGRYWVRIYSETGSTQPLQEFGLRVD